MERTTLEDGGEYKDMEYFLMFLLGIISCYILIRIYNTKRRFGSQRKITKYVYRLKLKWYRFKYKIKR